MLERKGSCLDFTRYGMFMLWHGHENVQRTHLANAKEQGEERAFLGISTLGVLWMGQANEMIY